MHRSGFAKVGQLKLRKEVSMSTKEKWKRYLLRPNRISYRYVLCASPEKMTIKNLEGGKDAPFASFLLLVKNE